MSTKRAERLIPNRLRKYRRIMGLEQTEVAFLLGLKSHARISEWETGVARPSLENLFRLSILYRTLPDELYYDVREELQKDMETRRRMWQAMRDEGG